MPGYLLDANHLSIAIKPKVDALPTDAVVRVCAITLGEMEYGHQRNPSPSNPSRRDEVIAWIRATFSPNILPIGETTGIYYAKLLAAIMSNQPPKPRSKTEQYLASLGVDINDVWIVSVALEHGLTLVTQDTMEVIRKAAGSELKTECWLPATHPSAS